MRLNYLAVTTALTCSALSCSALSSAKNILVVGGSGRVGASTVRWLDKLGRRRGDTYKLVIGGRDETKFAESRRAGRLPNATSFANVDLDGGDAEQKEQTASPPKGTCSV